MRLSVVVILPTSSSPDYSPGRAPRPSRTATYALSDVADPSVHDAQVNLNRALHYNIPVTSTEPILSLVQTMLPEKTVQVDKPQLLDSTLLQHDLEIQPIQLDASFQKSERRPPPLSDVSEWAPIALAFAAGTAIILSAYKPGTYRRRFAVLGFGCGAYAVEQFLTRNSVSSPENADWNIREVKGAEFPNGLSRIFPWYQTITYAGGTGSPAHERRRDALRKLQSHVSNETVLKYLERERMYDDQTTLGKRIAFQWHNMWSSVETRAAVDDVIHTYLSATGIAGNIGIPEHDIRHFVTYTASALEYDWIERRPFGYHRYSFYAAVAGGVLCSGSWVVAAAGVGTSAFVHHFGQVLRWSQFWEGALKYANPEWSSALPFFWYDWVSEERTIWRSLVESSRTEA